MPKFETSFWDNPGPGQQPRYERGAQVLYDKLEQGASECDELLSFLRDRVALEESYAKGLQELSMRKAAARGFGRDEGATLRTAYQGMIDECGRLAEAHSTMALELVSRVVGPLRTFANEHRARVRSSWKIMDDNIRKSTAEIVQVERNHRVYTQKAALAEKLRFKEGGVTANGPFPQGEQQQQREVKPRVSTDGSEGIGRSVLDAASIVLGNVALTRHEFHVMLQRMQAEVPQHDVKFGILGTFRGLISGESLAGWWCTNYPTVVRSEEEAVEVGQSLMTQGYLRFMGRGSQFQSRSNAYYQWKKPALDFQSDDEVDSDDDKPLIRGFMSSRPATYERAQNDADSAAHIYRDSVIKAELARTDLEEQLTNHLETMEVWELNRLINIKSTFNSYAQVTRAPIEIQLSINDRLEVYEESIKPAQDIQWTIEHYGTGRFSPRPLVFRPYGLSPAEYQVFGVALEEQMLVSHKDIPLFPAKALSLIHKQAKDMTPEDRFSIWTARPLLRTIHDLHNDINSQGSKVTLKQLRRYELPVVVNTLFLYLLELPSPLCPDEIYDPLRALYSMRNSSDKEGDDAFHAITHLLQGISYAHLRTLQTLFSTLSQQIAQASGVTQEKKDEIIKEVARRLGGVIMRGREPIGASVNRLPECFARDLIEHYDAILGPIKLDKPQAVGEHSESSGKLVTDVAKLDIAGPSNHGGEGASSTRSRHSTPRQSVEDHDRHDSGDFIAADSALAAPPEAKHKLSFDDDEVSVDSIIEETSANDGAADQMNNHYGMEFFLKDEDTDDSDVDFSSDDREAKNSK